MILPVHPSSSVILKTVVPVACSRDNGSLTSPSATPIRKDDRQPQRGPSTLPRRFEACMTGIFSRTQPPQLLCEPTLAMAATICSSYRIVRTTESGYCLEELHTRAPTPTSCRVAAGIAHCLTVCRFRILPRIVSTGALAGVRSAGPLYSLNFKTWWPTCNAKRDGSK